MSMIQDAVIQIGNCVKFPQAQSQAQSEAKLPAPLTKQKMKHLMFLQDLAIGGAEKQIEYYRKEQAKIEHADFFTRMREQQNFEAYEALIKIEEQRRDVMLKQAGLIATGRASNVVLSTPELDRAQQEAVRRFRD